MCRLSDAAWAGFFNGKPDYVNWFWIRNDKAGIKAGDIFTKFDNQSLRDEKADLAKIVSQKKVGDKVSLTIWRDGKEMEKEVVLQQATE